MNIARRERESHHLLKHFKLLCAAHPQHVERESRLLNPPPGSTDPERSRRLAACKTLASQAKAGENSR